MKEDIQKNICLYLKFKRSNEMDSLPIYKTAIVEKVNSNMNKVLYSVLDISKLRFIKNTIAFDTDDIKQELLIILLRSIDKYDDKYETSFYTYYINNIKKRIKQLLSFVSAKKRKFNSMIFLDNIIQDDSINLLETITDKRAINKDEILTKIDLDYLDKFLEDRYDKYILKALRDNHTYKEISSELNKSISFVANRLNKIRFKYLDNIERKEKVCLN